MKWTIWISILLLCLTGIGEVQAQNDPVLAGMIAVYTEKAEKELKNQEKVMLMQTTGHIWTKEEVQDKSTSSVTQKLRSAVLYIAQILSCLIGNNTKRLSLSCKIFSVANAVSINVVF